MLRLLQMRSACQSILWKRNNEILYLLWDRLRKTGHRGWRGGSVSRTLTALAKNEREFSSQNQVGQTSIACLDLQLQRI